MAFDIASNTRYSTFDPAAILQEKYDNNLRTQANNRAQSQADMQATEFKNSLADREAKKQQDAQSTQAKQTLAETEWAIKQPSKVQAINSLPHVVQALKDKGLDTSTLSEEQASQLLQGVRMHVSSILGIGPPEDKYQAVAGGTTLTRIPQDGGTPEAVYTAPTEEKPVGAPFTAVKDGKTGLFERTNKGVRPIEGLSPPPNGGAGNQPPNGYRWTKDGGLEAIPGGPADQNRKTDPRTAMPLRKEFDNIDAVKNYRSTLTLVTRAANAPNTKAGDLSVVYALGKIFDPNSVVREGELQLSQNAQPWLQKLAAQANSQITGEGAMSPELRKQIVDAMRGQVDAYGQAYAQTRDQYTQYANDAGFDPSYVVGRDPADAYKPKAPSPVTPQSVPQPGQTYQHPSGAKVTIIQ